MAQRYTNLLIRVRAKDTSTGLHPVEAELDDGSRPSGGALRLDAEELLRLELDSAAYGMALFRALFAGPIRSAYDRAIGRSLAETGGRLRVRLWIEDSASELHTIPWERLYHPFRGQEVPLTASHATPFSRYTGLDMPEPRPIAQRPIRLLLAISNPSDIEAYEMAKVDVSEDARSFIQNLAHLRDSQVTVMPGRTGLPPDLRLQFEEAGCNIVDGPLTLDAITRALPGHTILHLVSHGTLTPNVGAALYLEDANGKVALIDDVEVAAKFAPLDPQPHLVYLAACESAGRDARNPMIGLAPRLVAAGIPAVVGMQVPVSVTVDRQFGKDFYRRLLEHGVVDRAVNEARNLLVDRDLVDWSTPVLFMRLRDGQIVDERKESEQLPESSIGNHDPSDGYLSLQKWYRNPWQALERVNLECFVGREWLLSKIDDFLYADDRGGYFVLEAAAGLGKTTFLAWLVSQRDYIHHFCEFTPGLENVQLAINSISAQLIQKHNLEFSDAGFSQSDAAIASSLLHKLLLQAALSEQRREKVVLVIDALDEAGTPANQNVLGLPSVLPRGVYIIVSQRPVPVALHVDSATTRRLVVTFDSESAENLSDMRRFLQRAATWPGISKALQQVKFSDEQFVSRLLEKCRGVWIYLHYVVHEIERGERSPLDWEELPNGMTQYYISFWERWRNMDEQKWYAEYLPLLATLGAAQEPLPITWLKNWSGTSIPNAQVQALLSRQWRPFVAISNVREGSRYGFYHATLRDLFGGHVDSSSLESAEIAFVHELIDGTLQAHERISEYFLVNWGEIDNGLPNLYDSTKETAIEGYGLRYVALHLDVAKRQSDLHNLLAVKTSEGQNAWYLIKESNSDTAGYLADIMRAWKQLELSGATVDADSHDDNGNRVGLMLRYAMIAASLRSLANNVTPLLLASRVQSRIWTPAQGLAYTSQMTESASRSQALKSLAPLLPESFLQEALGVAYQIEDLDERTVAIAALFSRFVAFGHFEQALVSIEAINSEIERSRALVGLIPYLGSFGQFKRILQLATQIRSRDLRMATLVDLLPWLPEPLNERVRKEVLDLVQRTWDWPLRFQILLKLMPFLREREETWALGQAIEIVIRIKEHKARRNLWRELWRYLPKEKQDWVDSRERIMSGSGIRPRANSESLESELEDISKSADSLGDSEETVLSSSKISLHNAFPEPQPKPLSKIQPLDDEAQCSELQAQIALQVAQLGADKDAISIASGIPWEPIRAECLANLAPWLSETTLHDALEVADTIKNEYWRIRALVSLSIDGSSQDDDQEKQEDPRLALRCEAIEVPYRSIFDLLVPDTGDIIDAVLTQHPSSRVELLPRLIPHLHGVFLERAFNEVALVVEAYTTEEQRTNLLLFLTQYIPESQFEAMLDIAMRLKQTYLKEKSLARLARRSAEYGNLQQSLSIVGEIKAPGRKAQAATQLLPFLGIDHWRFAMQEVGKIVNPDERAWALQRLVPCLLEVSPDNQLLALQSTLRNPVVRGRLDLLSDITALLPLVAEIGGIRSLCSAALAIQDVVHWWP